MRANKVRYAHCSYIVGATSQKTPATRAWTRTASLQPRQGRPSQSKGTRPSHSTSTQAPATVPKVPTYRYCTVRSTNEYCTTQGRYTHLASLVVACSARVVVVLQSSVRLPPIDSQPACQSTANQPHSTLCAAASWPNPSRLPANANASMLAPAWASPGLLDQSLRPTSPTDA